MGTWQALIGSASFSLINGGLAGSIWSYIATWICTISVTLSLAEMSSMAPTSGGQYHCEKKVQRVFMRFMLTFVGD
jgi:choline transport protein